MRSKLAARPLPHGGPEIPPTLGWWPLARLSPLLGLKGKWDPPQVALPASQSPLVPAGGRHRPCQPLCARRAATRLVPGDPGASRAGANLDLSREER